MTHRQPSFGHQHHHGHGRRTRRSAAASEESSTGFNYPFQGMAVDPAKLYDFRIRVFSPTVQRWAQHEPVGYVDGLNVYNVPPDLARSTGEGPQTPHPLPHPAPSRKANFLSVAAI